jgi:hypothetical protein
MKSPFKMMPGRGNMPKTGRGLAPTLMCGSPMKQETEIELTRKFDEGKKKMAAARKTPGKIADIESTQGIKVDTRTGGASVKSYEKKYIPGDMKKGVRAKIISGEGKLVKEAKLGEDDKLKKEFERAKTFTAKTRGTNASQYNITSGAKSTNKATEREKQMLVNIGKAKKA